MLFDNMYSVLKNMYTFGDITAADTTVDLVSNSITFSCALATTFSPRFELPKHEHYFASNRSVSTNANANFGCGKAKKDHGWGWI